MLFASGSDSRDGGTSAVTFWNDASGDLVAVGSIELRSPSWVTAHPKLPVLYVTEESERGSVVVLTIDDAGQLRERQRVPSHGGLPCHLAIDPTGTQLAVSNYLDGVVALLALTPSGEIAEPRGVWQLSGSGSDAERQESSHAHAAYFRDGSLLVADLGADRIWSIGARGADRGEPTTALVFPPGFGPRHLVEWGNDRAVVVGELSSQLALIELHPERMRVLHTVPATELAGAQPSGIATGGDSVIVANRGVGTLAEFRVIDDRLVPVREARLPGDAPRAICVEGGRVLVCVQDAGLLVRYPGDVVGIAGAPTLTAAPHVSVLARNPAAIRVT